MKKLSIFIILIVVIGAILYFWNVNKANHTPPITDEAQNWIVSFQFSETESSDVNFSSLLSLNLAQITKSISQQENWEYQFEDYGDMGILITQIKNKQNGQDQKYWQYFVDNQQPQISADKYFPTNGTSIAWKFIKSEF